MVTTRRTTLDAAILVTSVPALKSDQSVSIPPNGQSASTPTTLNGRPVWCM
jgi:hypothetical protein